MTGDGWVPGGRLLGRFRLREMIGAGDMGVVWRADDELLGRTVAVKRIAGSGPDVVERVRHAVLREGRMGTLVAHPRLLRVLDVIGTDDGEPCLVLQHVAGLPWATVWTRPGRRTPRAVAHIAAQVAEALAALHAAGVVHGDVTPENVLVTDDGEAKLVDFGAARLLGESPNAGMTWATTGTRDHRAPEVREGARAGAPADVYALGATTRAATGVASAGPLHDLVERMLAADPADRPTATDAAAGFAAVAAA